MASGSEEMLHLGSNVYKVVPGAEPDHLAEARALAQGGGGLISLGEEETASSDYRTSLESYAPEGVPEEGVPPSDAIAALRKQVGVTLAAMTAERDALLAALRAAKVNEQKALTRVAELEAKYESKGSPASLAAGTEPRAHSGSSSSRSSSPVESAGTTAMAPAPVTATTEQIVEATFTQPGSLGLKLNEYDPGDGAAKRAVVVHINKGTQGEHHPQLHAGLLVRQVGDTDARGLNYSEMLSLLRASKQRPITLTFDEPAPEPEDPLCVAATSAVDRMPRAFLCGLAVKRAYISGLCC